MPYTRMPNRGRRPAPRNNKRTPTKVHLYSRVETTLTLKQKPKKRERYPLKFSDLFNESSVGADTDIRAVGYNIKLEFATGNQTQTVSTNLGHDGDWVRRGQQADTFNQAFQTRPLRRNSVVFNKRVLPMAEREFISPHKSDSGFLLQVDDPCGVVPGCTIKITATIHFIRDHLPTLLVGADDPYEDLYEDQDVSSPGSGPTPPQIQYDVPQQIIYSGTFFTTTDSASPFNYSKGGGQTFTVTIPQTPVNIVGIFSATNINTLQQQYTKEGFEGVIISS